jgi:NAD(P)H dehydrogenase (quinone)
VIRGPAGDGRVAAVTRDDIADAAVAVLLDDGDGHDRRTYDMTGPQALTLDEAAGELSTAAGRLSAAPTPRPQSARTRPRAPGRCCHRRAARRA